MSKAKIDKFYELTLKFKALFFHRYFTAISLFFWYTGFYAILYTNHHIDSYHQKNIISFWNMQSSLYFCSRNENKTFNTAFGNRLPPNRLFS